MILKNKKIAVLLILSLFVAGYLLFFFIMSPKTQLSENNTSWSRNSMIGYSFLFNFFIFTFGMVIISKNLIYWISGLILQTILMIIYTIPGAYGFGVRTDIIGNFLFYSEEKRIEDIVFRGIFAFVEMFLNWIFVVFFFWIYKKVKNQRSKKADEA